MSAVLAIAERFVRAIEAGDVDTVRSIYADDAVIWHNFDGIEQTREQNLATLKWLVSRLDERRYEVQRREATSDGWFQQHVLHGRARNGTVLAMPACLVVRMAGERIARLDEYLDPSQAAALQA